MSDEDNDLKTAVLVFAHYLGINLNTEPDLIRIAEEAFENLPPGWEFGIGEEDHAGIPYFYNTETNQSDWVHPEESIYIRKVAQARKDGDNRSNKQSRNNGGNTNNSRNSTNDDRAFEAPRNNHNNQGNQSSRSRDETPPRSARGRDEAVEVEDFDDEESPANSPVKKVSHAVTSNVATKPHTSTGAGFGMSANDFFDDDDEEEMSKTSGRSSNNGGKSNFQQTGKLTTATRETDVSPPMFRTQNALMSTSRDSHDVGKGFSVYNTANKTVNSVAGNTNKWNLEKESDKDRVTSPQRATVQHTQQESARDNKDIRDNRDDRDTSRGNGNRDDGGRLMDSSRRGSQSSNSGASSARERDQTHSKDYNQSYNQSNRDREREREREQNARGNNYANNDYQSRNRDTDRNNNQGSILRNDDYSNQNSRGRTTSNEKDRNGSNPRGVTIASSAYDGANRSGSSGNSTTIGSETYRRNNASTNLAAMDTGVSSIATSAELDQLKSIISRVNNEKEQLEDRHNQVQKRLNNEINTHLDTIQRLETQRHELKHDLKLAEDRIVALQSDSHGKLRDTEETHEIKQREVIRKLKLEFDEELKEKLRICERRYSDEADSLRTESMGYKRKYEDALRETEALKRKLSVNKLDGMLETQNEVDAIRATLRDLEETHRLQSIDLRKVREENVTLNARVVAAIQSGQIASAECDVAKTMASNAVQENQANNSALMQATHRIMQIETECAAVKAENTVLRKEKESALIDLRKLQGTVGYNEDRLSATESKTRQIQAAAQAEIGRLTSRTVELDALVSVLRTQFDKAADSEQDAVRDIKRELERTQCEVIRYKDRLQDSTVKEDNTNVRVKNLEAEVLKQQELVFKKERQLKDEIQRIQSLQNKITEIRSESEHECEQLRNMVNEQNHVNMELTARHKQEMESVQIDVSQKIPTLIAAAIEKVDISWAKKLEKSVSEISRTYEQQIDRQKRELMEMQSAFTEREATLKLSFTEEKVELDRLRVTYKSTKRQFEEAEQTIDDLRREIRRMMSIAASGGMNVTDSHDFHDRQGYSYSSGRQYGHNNSMRESGGSESIYNSRHHETQPTHASQYGSGGGGRGRESGSVNNSIADFSALIERNHNQIHNSRYQQQQQQQRQYAETRDNDEDSIASQAVALINTQLSAMKQQLNDQNNKSNNQRHHNNISYQGNRDADHTYGEEEKTSSSYHMEQSRLRDLPPNPPPLSVSRNVTADHRDSSRLHHSSNQQQQQQHVTFSAESLFASPTAKVRPPSTNRSFQRFDNSSELGVSLLSQSAFDESLLHGTNDHKDASVGANIKQSRNDKSTSGIQPTIDYEYPEDDEHSSIYNTSAHSIHFYPNISNSKYLASPSFLQYTAPTPSRNGQFSSIGSRRLETIDEFKGDNDGQYSTSKRSSTKFDAVSDGGYYEGYWKAKYTKNNTGNIY